MFITITKQILQTMVLNIPFTILREVGKYINYINKVPFYWIECTHNLKLN